MKTNSMRHSFKIIEAGYLNSVRLPTIIVAAFAFSGMCCAPRYDPRSYPVPLTYYQQRSIAKAHLENEEAVRKSKLAVERPKRRSATYIVEPEQGGLDRDSGSTYNPPVRFEIEPRRQSFDEWDNQRKQQQLMERQTEALEGIQREQSWDNFERSYLDLGR